MIPPIGADNLRDHAVILRHYLLSIKQSQEDVGAKRYPASLLTNVVDACTLFLDKSLEASESDAAKDVQRLTGLFKEFNNSLKPQETTSKEPGNPSHAVDKPAEGRETELGTASKENTSQASAAAAQPPSKPALTIPVKRVREEEAQPDGGIETVNGFNKPERARKWRRKNRGKDGKSNDTREQNSAQQVSAEMKS